MKQRTKAMLIALMAMACIMVGCDDGDDDKAASTNTVSVTVSEVQKLIINKETPSTAIALTGDDDDTALLKKMAACKVTDAKTQTATVHEISYTFNSAKFSSLTGVNTVDTTKKATILLTTGDNGSVTLEVEADTTDTALGSDGDQYVITGTEVKKDGTVAENASLVLAYYDAAKQVVDQYVVAEAGPISAGDVIVDDITVAKAAGKDSDGASFTQWMFDSKAYTFNSSTSKSAVPATNFYFFMNYGSTPDYAQINTEGKKESTVVINKKTYLNSKDTYDFIDNNTIADYLMANFKKAFSG